MKFKAGMTKRRIRYATALFQQNPEISMTDVSKKIKRRYGSGMAGKLLSMCQRTAEAERDAKRAVNGMSKTEKDAMRARHVEKYRTFDKTPKRTAVKDQKVIPMVAEIRWSSDTSKARGRNGFPAEFYEGLRMVRTALKSSADSGVIRMTLVNEKVEVFYDLQKKVEKRGQFEVKD